MTDPQASTLSIEPQQAAFPAGCITTASGKLFNVMEPRAEDVDINDIAHALAHQCRFGGHTREFMSVAQHSLLVLSVIGNLLGPDDIDLQLAALLHDAPEAYLVDVPRPVKEDRRMEAYRFAEDRVWRAIAHAFDVPAQLIHYEALRRADDMVLVLEARTLMPEDTVALPPGVGAPRWLVGFRPVSPAQAREGFLAAYRQLVRARNKQRAAESDSRILTSVQN